MKLVERKVVTKHRPKCAPVCEFVSYVHPEQPVLLRRMGWEIGNDVHDDLTDSFSFDNGQSWSEPRPAYQAEKVDGGFLVHTEASVLFHAERNVLVTVTNEKFEADLNECDLSSPSKLRIQVTSPLAEQPVLSDFTTDLGIGHCLYVSFSVPILDSRGRILVPIQWQKKDPTGEIARQGFDTVEGYPDVLANVWESGLMIGEFNSSDDPQQANTLNWHAGAPVPYEFARTSRGLFEGTVIELEGGRLAMISRGSNQGWPEVPGYKWLAYSEDGGETWSEAEPLAFDDGSVPESGSSGSLLFRSPKTGKVYWLGNLCREGERADGNLPRNPISICEVQESPFALKKDTLVDIDGNAPHESVEVEQSNFKGYQDRETGDIVFYLTRYREHGIVGDEWMNADQYQYRVSLTD